MIEKNFYDIQLAQSHRDHESGFTAKAGVDVHPLRKKLKDERRVATKRGS